MDLSELYRTMGINRSRLIDKGGNKYAIVRNKPATLSSAANELALALDRSGFAGEKGCSCPNWAEVLAVVNHKRVRFYIYMD